MVLSKRHKTQCRNVTTDKGDVPSRRISMSRRHVEIMKSTFFEATEEAIQASDSNKWLVAMEEEMESLHKNELWQLVKPPTGKKIVGSKWLFRNKEGSSQDDIRYKARLVAKGYSQVERVDFHDVFSLVVKHTSIQELLALVALHNLKFEQIDVKTTFLHDDLEKNIYMQQPKGFKIKGKEDHISLLQKSLYDLKLSSRQWYMKFDSFMLSISFARIESLMYALVCTRPDISHVVSVKIRLRRERKGLMIQHPDVKSVLNRVKQFTDKLELSLSLLVGIVNELYGKLVDSVKEQLIWVTKEMISVSATADHWRVSNNLKLEMLRQMEIEFCVKMLRDQFQLCLRIGRDLVRLLQDLWNSWNHFHCDIDEKTIKSTDHLITREEHSETSGTCAEPSAATFAVQGLLV
ncbi:copia LTR rider [Gossypium australe]|uniref:Copia LTR rider n=1 Tax=Gossypium australe TaxID=47621 RepID=A0A5B6WFL0_9ROSI|nr:copia LTR rider [Gossypium australe]